MTPRKTGRPLAVLLVMACLACDAPTATRPEAAYDPTTLTGGLLYRWGSGTTVRVWVVAGALPTPIDLGLAVRQAIRQWNAVRQFAEFTLTSAANINEAEIVVYDREHVVPVAPGSCVFDPRGGAGYTYFCPTGGLPQRAERLALSAGGRATVTVVIRLDRGRVSTQRAYNAIMAHELGHALGIGAHSDAAGDLMFGLPTVESPSARDIATLRFLLGRPPGLIL